MPGISSFGITDVGLRRANNEDSFMVKPGLPFVAVADGMGGAASGEVASLIFCETAEQIFRKSSARSEDEMLQIVQTAFRSANEKTLETARLNPEHKGMGCTAELLAFFGMSYILGHVGDSRTYLMREGALRQITRDHSLVQDQIDHGLIRPEDAEGHTFKNVILRAVGVTPELAVDLVRGRSRPGDIFLLCSDGLHDMVRDSAIRDILTTTDTVAKKAGMLVESAKAGGGKDNITVVLCEVTP